MQLDKIEDILKNNTDRSRFNSGFVAYKNNKVINDYSKIDNGVATFYATVIDEHRRQNYTSMISINTNSRTISNVSCDCNNEFYNSKESKVCSHIVATVLKGIEELKNTNKKEVYTKEIVISPVVNMNISQSRNGYLGMDFNIEGVSKIEYRRIFNSFKEKKSLHRLSNGNYLDLKNENLKEAFNLIDVLGIYNDFENIKIPNNKTPYLESFIEENELDFIDGTKYVKNISKKFNSVKNSKYEVPSKLNAKLRDYQVKGFEFLSTLAEYEMGAILADEMGLGKTVQTIAFLLSKQDKKSIVITPTALIYNWRAEFEKFAKDLNIGIVHGNKTEREKALTNINGYDVILTTYGTYKNDIDKYENINFDYCIIDEAQNIKNPESIITKSIKNINAKVKFALTGTPIENNLLELWSIFDFIMPGYLYNKSKFKSIFINNDKNVIELKKLIKPFMLRRTKKEVIEELPDKIEQDFIIELDKEHRRVYNGYVKLVKSKILDNSQNNIEVLSYLTKLRQLCLAPEFMVKEYSGKNSKIDILLNLLKDESDKKILVFSQFTKVLGLIGDRLKEQGISYSYLDGKTNAKDRVKLVDEFNNNDTNKVFLISLKAGGTGLNLTSASVVIHFDPWWNPAVEDQASDRAHRIGQKNVVNVIKFIAKCTIEERVVNLQRNKKDLINDIMDPSLSDSSRLKKLSKDELIELFMD